MYLATEPKPGQLSVPSRSLSTVLGMATHTKVAALLCKAGDFEGGVGGIVAAVVEEIPDVVSGEDLKKPLVGRAVLLGILELHPAGAEDAARRPGERLELAALQPGGVVKLLAQSPEDAVSGPEDFADAATAPGGGDDRCGGRVDHGRDAAGLGIE